MQLVINIFYHSPHENLEAVFWYRHRPTTQWRFVGPANATRLESLAITSLSTALAFRYERYKKNPSQFTRKLRFNFIWSLITKK